MRPILNQDDLHEELKSILLFRKGAIERILESYFEDCADWKIQKHFDLYMYKFSTHLAANFCDPADMQNTTVFFIDFASRLLREKPRLAMDSYGVFMGIFYDIKRALDSYGKYNPDAVLMHDDPEKCSHGYPKHYYYSGLKVAFSMETKHMASFYLFRLEDYAVSRSPY